MGPRPAAQACLAVMCLTLMGLGAVGLGMPGCGPGARPPARSRPAVAPAASASAAASATSPSREVAVRVAVLGSQGYRHTARVADVAVSPDGRLLATRVAAVREPVLSAVAVWSTASRLKRFQRLGSTYAWLRGGVVAVGARDGAVELVDEASGNQTGRLEGHRAPVTALAAHLAAGWLASGDERGELRLWRYQGEQLGPEPAATATGTGPVRAIAASGSGERFVAAWDGGAELRLGADGGLVTRLPALPAGAGILELSDDGTRLLAVDFVAASATAGDRRAVVLDTTSGKRLCAERALRSAHLSSDGRTVVLARDGGEIALLDATSGRERTRLRFEPAAVAALALDRGTGRIAALGGRELDVYGPSGAVEQRLELAELSSGALAFAPDGATLYLAHGQAVRAFEVATGNEPVAVLGHVSKVRTVAVSADGALALTGGADATVRLWDAQSGQQLGLLGGHGAPVTVVVVAPDGSVGASAADDGSVRLWDLRARRELRDLVGHERSWPVRALALSADGRLLCSGGDYSEAKLWEVASGDLVRSIDWPTGSVRVAWVGFADQAGRELVTVSDGGQLERWDLASSPPARLGGWVLAPEPVALALGADRNELLAASGDGAIVLRKVADGSEIVRLTGAPSPTSVLLAAGRMVSGHADGRVRLWPTAGGPERAFATRGGAVLALGLGGSDRLLVGQQDTTATVWRLRPEAATR